MTEQEIKQEVQKWIAEKGYFVELDGTLCTLFDNVNVNDIVKLIKKCCNGNTK